MQSIGERAGAIGVAVPPGFVVPSRVTTSQAGVSSRPHHAGHTSEPTQSPKGASSVSSSRVIFAGKCSSGLAPSPDRCACTRFRLLSLSQHLPPQVYRSTLPPYTVQARSAGRPASQRGVRPRAPPGAAGARVNRCARIRELSRPVSRSLLRPLECEHTIGAGVDACAQLMALAIHPLSSQAVSSALAAAGAERGCARATQPSCE